MAGATRTSGRILGAMLCLSACGQGGKGGGSSSDAADGGAAQPDLPAAADQTRDGVYVAPDRGATPPPASAIYVDLTIAASRCADYDPAARACGAGSGAAYRSLADACAVAVAGDTVVLRQGTYAEPLVPKASGSEGKPLTFTVYPGETATLTGDASPAMIQLDAVSWVILDGLRVENARWLEAQSAHHNIVRYCTFLSTPATGTTGNLRFVRSNDNLVLGNLIDSGNDNLLLIDSQRNVVTGNTITEARHSIFGIRCGDQNVIRQNHFANSQQKIGEVYDCGADTSAVPNSFDSTKRNLIEGNEFTLTDRYYSTSGGNGIQYAGQDGILRRNVFRNANVGLGMQTYDDEALYNRGNRVYHNVFTANECAGISLGEDTSDNVFVNNILAQNLGWDGDCAGDSAAQLLYRGSLASVRFLRNDLWGGGTGLPVILEEFGAGGTLASFETTQAASFQGNLELDPGFVDAAAFDFRLGAQSPLRDQGAFLTTAVAAGSGTTLAVVDARFFYDGFGITGETGDTIQLAGQPGTAVVAGCDVTANVLTLDRPLTWTAGQGVALAYQGGAPDIGAFEAP
jgi:hypothetical protein